MSVHAPVIPCTGRSESVLETGVLAMQKFSRLSGVAAPMPIVNVDTDMIIPKDYLKTIRRAGLGAGLFAEMRFNEDGSRNPDFVLNKPAYEKARILIAGDNFGCGSSREHAPWALMDFGIRCVISTGFADIFYNNSFKNGLLPVILEPTQVDQLFDFVESNEGAQITVDLKQMKVLAGEMSFGFELDEFRRECLLKGLDEIGLTLAHSDAIRAYEASRAQVTPWMFADLAGEK